MMALFFLRRNLGREVREWGREDTQRKERRKEARKGNRKKKHN